MTPTITFAAEAGSEAAVVATGVRADRFDLDTQGLDGAYLAAHGFEGKPKQSLLVADAGGSLRLLLGLGAAADVDATVLRRAAGVAARAANREPSLALDLLGMLPEGTAGAERRRAAQALSEGVILGGYQYLGLKTATPGASQLAEVTVVGHGGKPLQAAVERGAAVAAAVCLARDLVNEPGGTLIAPAFADRAVAAAEAAGLNVEVWDEAVIVEQRLGGLLGVNRGSDQPARFVTISHRPARPRGSVALVGKGITFDSGGLSMKSPEAMVGMKGDCGGAAAVLAAMTLVPGVAPRLAATAYLPLTDNMTGGDATRVGDVLVHRNNQTTEVLNTDAEGRLVLADALALATEDPKPQAVIDLATLTGACMVALGPKTAGLFSGHDGLGERVRAAAEATGEQVWPMPLLDHLRPTLDSDIADLRNVGTGRHGGASVAALFLREFVAEGVPWAHLDIAGPSYVSDTEGEIVKGGTGFGVRLLVELLGTWTRP